MLSKRKVNMPYDTRASDKTPALVIYLVDVSSSMNQNMGGKRRIDLVSDTLRNTFHAMVNYSSKGGTISPRYRVAVYAYNDDVFDVLGGIKTVDRPLDVVFPDSKMKGMTNAAIGFIAVEKLLQQELPQLANCPAPRVIHITDGEYNGSDPKPIVRRIMSMSVPDGNVLVAHIFISDDLPTVQQTVDSQWGGLLTSTDLNSSYANELRDLSSPLPKSYYFMMEENGYRIQDGALMMLPGKTPEFIKMGFAMSMATPNLEGPKYRSHINSKISGYEFELVIRKIASDVEQVQRKLDLLLVRPANPSMEFRSELMRDAENILSYVDGTMGLLRDTSLDSTRMSEHLILELQEIRERIINLRNLLSRFESINANKPFTDPYGNPSSMMAGQKIKGDNVYFAVTSLPRVLAGENFQLDFWMYLLNKYDDVIRMARKELATDHIMINSEGPLKVKRSTELYIEAVIEGMKIDPPHKLMLWSGGISKASFNVSVYRKAEANSYPGTVTVYFKGMRIAQVCFLIKVGDATANVKPLPVDVKFVQKAFASYSSKDRAEVLGRIQGMQKILPNLSVFVDVLSLRSGQDWEYELWKVIPTYDVFYLFWSKNAKSSNWVEKEWRCALDKRGIDYIDPVPLVSPKEAPPPPELASKHFNDWMLPYIHAEKEND
jgi:hypothetical protein